MMTKMSTWWNQREARERMMLGGGSLILFFALTYAYFWFPAMAERDKLLTTLPALRIRAQAMEQSSQLVQSLHAPSATSKTDSVTAARTLFSTLSLNVESDGGMRISSSAARLDDFIKQLATWEKTTGGKVKDCDIIKTTPGMTSISCLITP